MQNENELLDQGPQSRHSWRLSHILIEENTGIRADGRVDVDVNKRLANTLSRLLPPPPRIETSVPAPQHSQRSSWSVKLNIVIQVVGSRGDVQPFIALGNALQKYGHRVRLATHNVFKDFATKSNLEFFPIGGDPAELMAYMVKNPGLIPSTKSLRDGEIQRKRIMVGEMLEGCWKSCIMPDPQTDKPFVADAIIANPPSFAHVHCAQALGVPVHLMFTMPWSSTKSFPHPLTNLKYSNTDPKLGNYLSYGIVDFLTWQGIGSTVNKWRVETLDLEPVSVSDGPFLLDTLKVPFTYCWSPSLIPKPLDWPSHIDVCGFFFRDPPSYTPSPELRDFLAAGPAPVYIGFGSIVIERPEEMTAILLAAIKITSVRAIISKGWSELGGEELPNVLYLGDCPHEWLFQQVKAVVHHGGAGTTACGLYNGKPTTIVPFFGDQPFWGAMVHAAGAGPAPINHKALNSKILAEAIEYCLTPEALAAARALSEKMINESGVEAAVKSFHANLPLQSLQCDLIPDRPAAWTYKNGGNVLKLSKLAIAVLSSHTKLSSKNITSHESRPIYIQTTRWEPITAISSASLATVGDLANNAVGVFVKPYEEYKKRRPEDSKHTSLAEQNLPSSSTSSEEQLATVKCEESESLHGKAVNNQKAKKEGSGTAGAMIRASATGFGNVLFGLSKGALVDIPVAAADGMRSVPQMYNHQAAADYGKVTDWKSGTTVAGKTFAHGMYEGFTDIFKETYKGKQKEGAAGVAKGLGKGLVSMTMKTSAGAVGLVAYPAQGICKSIYTAVKSTTRKRIEDAKTAEGNWLIKREVGNNLDQALLCAEFKNSMKG